MAAKKRTKGKSVASTKKTVNRNQKVDIEALFSKQLNQQPVGKALAAIDILYQQLDDMEVRLEILIARIEILKKRTDSLRKGDTISLNTVLGTLLGDNPRSFLKHGTTQAETDEGKETEAVEWIKLKLTEETTINDVLLASDTIVSIESRAAASLIDKGVAAAVEEISETEEEANGEAEQTK